MKAWFNLIYIVPNNFSKEHICVGVLANIDDIPYLGIADRKLNFALSYLHPSIRTAIRKSFRLLDFDVNKIRRGEDTMPLFDPPYSKKLLKELAYKKRGVVRYSEMFELERTSTGLFEKIFRKFTGEEWLDQKHEVITKTFKKRFKEFTEDRKFDSFERNFKLTAGDYPFILKDLKVDLLRKSNYYTAFYPLDISRQIGTIQGNINRFRLIVQSLRRHSEFNGLGKGRYYLVYESTSDRSKLDIINKIQSEENPHFELIRISEMKDKI